jgi:hypothetical protein
MASTGASKRSLCTIFEVVVSSCVQNVREHDSSVEENDEDKYPGRGKEEQTNTVSYDVWPTDLCIIQTIFGFLIDLIVY